MSSDLPRRAAALPTVETVIRSHLECYGLPANVATYHHASDDKHTVAPRLAAGITEALAAAGVLTTPTPACLCEASPPEFGGNLPDRECPLHGEPTPAPDTNQREQVTRVPQWLVAGIEDAIRGLDGHKQSPISTWAVRVLLAAVSAPSEAQALRDRLRDLADEWDAEAGRLAPDDDWGDSMDATVAADVLRSRATRLRRALLDRDQPGGGEAWECKHNPRCADAACSHNPAMQRWTQGGGA